MNRIGMLATASLFGVLCTSLGQTPNRQIEMVPVKYDQLKAEVLKHRGKVVVVDFWAGYSAPCMAAMPHLVEMHKKYADKGLVVITVSVDPPTEKEMVKNANAFLRKIDAPFRNLLLDEPDEMWSKKLNFDTPPCYYLFDRQGKWVRFRSTDYRKGVPYDEVDKIVVQMLNDK